MPFVHYNINMLVTSEKILSFLSSEESPDKTDNVCEFSFGLCWILSIPVTNQIMSTHFYSP